MECPRCGRLLGNGHTEICALQGEIERLRATISHQFMMLQRCADTIDCLRDYVVEGGSIRMVGARQSVDDADTLLAAMAGGE